MIDKHESTMHLIADNLMDHFNDSNAINYIEQTFEDKENPSRSFVLTMQMKVGPTPCQKLASANDRIVKLEKGLNEVIEQTKNGFFVCPSCGNQESTASDDVSWMAENALIEG